MGPGGATSFDELLRRARAVLNPRRLSESAEAGGVGAALLAESGAVYVGVCIDTGSSMGYCAEHAAAAAMVTAGESRVLKMVAVDWDGSILPPCGRCREFIRQLHDGNSATEVMVGDGVIATILELLPYGWREAAR
jgi:cytidine deaminase